MTHKLLISVAALCLLSGCCRYLGICTSASVHTSITSPQQFAQRGCMEGIQVSQVPVVADARVARGIQPNCADIRRFPSGQSRTVEGRCGVAGRAGGLTAGPL